MFSHKGEEYGEMEDLDAEFTMKQHMEQQTLMKKMTDHIEKDNEIYSMFSGQ